MKDYYLIGELSKIYGIGRDSLMYYEKLGILNPVRDSNGYRLYPMSDIWKLNLVKELRTFNFSMDKIKNYIDSRTLDNTQEMLNEEICLIDKKIDELEHLKSNVWARLGNISYAKENTIFNTPRLIYIEDRRALKLNGDISRDEEVDYLIKKLQKENEDKFYLLGNTKIGAIYNTDSLKRGIYNSYKAVFCLMDNKENKDGSNLIFKEGYYASISYRGTYSSNKIYLERLYDFIKENGYIITSDPIEIYKIDVHETSITEEYMTEIQVPVDILNGR